MVKDYLLADVLKGLWKAIGYFDTMIYFPQQKVSLSWAGNGNYGKLDAIAQSRLAMEKVFEAVFSE